MLFLILLPEATGTQTKAQNSKCASSRTSGSSIVVLAADLMLSMKIRLTTRLAISILNLNRIRKLCWHSTWQRSWTSFRTGALYLGMTTILEWMAFQPSNQMWTAAQKKEAWASGSVRWDPISRMENGLLSEQHIDHIWRVEA